MNKSQELKEEILDEIEKRISKMRSGNKSKGAVGDDLISIKVSKTNSHFKRIKVPGKKDIGEGQFFLLLEITALKETIYIPISVASGKKTVGFNYHIEGTAEGDIDTTTISCRGDGVTKITLGTLLYAKMPAGTTAEFRLFIKMKGRTSKEYGVAVNQVSYKLDPSDARYKKVEVELAAEKIKFL